MTMILSPDLPEVKPPILNEGDSIHVPKKERDYIKRRPGGKRYYKRCRSDKEELRTAYMKYVTEHAISLIKERFGNSDKSILLAGHNSSGVSLMKLLIGEAPGGENVGRLVLRPDEAHAVGELVGSAFRTFDRREDARLLHGIAFDDEPVHPGVQIDLDPHLTTLRHRDRPRKRHGGGEPSSLRAEPRAGKTSTHAQRDHQAHDPHDGHDDQQLHQGEGRAATS